MENRCEPQQETSLNTAPGPAEAQEMTTAQPEPRPWLRFWARTIDLNFFLIVLSYLAIIVTSFLVSGGLIKTVVLAITTIFALIVGGLFVVETLCLTIWGTTPGKWIANIRIQQENGEEPTLRQAFRRTILVFYRGLGLGIPVISFFTIMAGYNRVINKGITSWDEDCKTTFVQGPMPALRTIILIVLGLLTAYSTDVVYDFFRK